LSVEEMSAVRHEFVDGQIFAMAGGTPEHAALSAAVLVVLGGKLLGGRCRPYSADLRIRVLATGLATYPDAAVICGEPSRDPSSPTHVTNPTVVVEVLSTSTEEYDRGEKREHYQQIPALREYLLVSQDRRRVEVFRRSDGGAWECRVHESGDAVELPSLSVAFTTDELYDAAGIAVR
jgi:Uma2 family endonuclease